MKIDSALLDEIVAHAVRDAPNECCGLVVGRDGTATSARALENLAASPFRFDIDGRELIAFAFADEDEDEDQLTAIYHSHTRSAPYPSQTDVNFAAGWPGVEWLIVGVPKAKDAEPEVRSYLIEEGAIREVELEVT
ncbi:MAG: [CysO sulfur-carrier protein]-S-L-cysteine hydrolase [Solirubrobacteraceae bacterium]|nr:[CysO sulfur-carrier protein]-S-L-cysteine hydrolase [Solirubrobacteraceae bacterium]